VAFHTAQRWRRPQPDPRLSALADQRDDVETLRFNGEVDIETSPVFGEWLRHAGRRGTAEVIVDLRRVAFMDASGLRQLTRAARRLRDSGVRVTVRCTPGSPVARLFELAALDEALPLADQ
jgi:anti-sigma B factor antagonist